MKNLWATNWLILVFLVSGMGMVQAEIYKWNDEQGNTHYGERPPPHGNAGTVTIRKGPSAPDPVLEHYRERQQKLLDVMQQEREEKQAQDRKNRQEREESQRRCYSAKDRLRSYGSVGALYKIDKKGKKIYLNQKDREKAIAKVEEDVRRYCK